MPKTVKSLRLLLSLVVLFGWGVRETCADTIVLQSDFESDTSGSKPIGSTVDDFAVTSGSVGVGAAGSLFCAIAGDLTSCLILQTDLVQNPNSTITSAMSFSPGNYSLMWDMAIVAPVAATLQVSLGNYTETLTTLDIPLATYTRSVSLTSTSALSFSLITPTSGSALALDNITLTRVEVIPEPSSMLLCGTAAAALLWRLRKRSSRI